VALTEIDRSLLKACLANEPGAWKNFVDRFLGLMIHVIQHTAQSRSIPIHPADVDDLCSEVFVTLLHDDMALLRRFRGGCSLATYLAVVARRIVVREFTTRRKAESLGHVHATTNGHLDEQRRIDDRDQLSRMMSRLPKLEAEVVRQFHLEGRSYKEISHGLGIPVNSIGATLTRARERMRGTN